MQALLIGLFGMFGGLARYAISLVMPSPGGFPFATLCVNLVGAFFLPLWTQWLGNRLHVPEKFILAGGTGFCGAFTTFSSFGLDTVKLINHQQIGLAILYVLISLIVGLALSLSAVTLAQHKLRAHQVQALENEGLKQK